MEEYASILQYVVIAAVAIAVAWFFVSRIRGIVRHRRGGAVDTETADAEATARAGAPSTLDA